MDINIGFTRKIVTDKTIFPLQDQQKNLIIVLGLENNSILINKIFEINYSKIFLYVYI